MVFNHWPPLLRESEMSARDASMNAIAQIKIPRRLNHSAGEARLPRLPVPCLSNVNHFLMTGAKTARHQSINMNDDRRLVCLRPGARSTARRMIGKLKKRRSLERKYSGARQSATCVLVNLLVIGAVGFPVFLFERYAGLDNESVPGSPRGKPSLGQSGADRKVTDAEEPRGLVLLG